MVERLLCFFAATAADKQATGKKAAKLFSGNEDQLVTDTFSPCKKTGGPGAGRVPTAKKY
jgi:hypothetical protein